MRMRGVGEVGRARVRTVAGAWIFGNALYNLTLLVLGASSAIAILLLWGALRWLVRAQKGVSG